MTATWLTAADALAILGVRPQTLYANVSRGLLRAKPDPADSRRRLYRAADVRRLAGRRRGGRKAAAVAAETIAWGEPILTTSISTVVDGRLWYRGRDAAALSETARLEDAAALLWDADAVSFAAAPGDAPVPADPDATPLARAFSALAARAGAEAPTTGRTPAVLHADGAAAVGALIAAVLADGGGGADAAVHTRIARAWGRPDAAEPLRRTLVLLADHELNASAFAARVAGSTGAGVAASLLAGLSALSGPRHGGGTARVRALTEAMEGADAAAAEATMRLWLEQGHGVPGFGHVLYPDGDVRAAALLETFACPPAFAALAEAGRRLTGEAPNVDFALAALSAAYALPAQAPLALFAMARGVGWVAHALEQEASGQLIRPRARYVGPAVGSDTD